MNKYDFLRASVDEGHFPKLVYKYRAPGKYTEEIFSNFSVWFSRPGDFNDPFDCNLSEVDHYDSKDLLQWHNKVATLHGDKIVDGLTDLEIENLSTAIRRAKEDQLSKLGVFSLSRTFDHLLMWSHYGSNHRGLALEFDILEDAECFTTPINVKYEVSYRPTNYPVDDHDAVTRNLCTKSADWTYEGEIRIVKRNGFGPVEFRPQALRRVIFGCRAAPNFILSIRDLCANNRLAHVKFAKLEMAHGRFSLDLKDIE